MTAMPWASFASNTDERAGSPRHISSGHIPDGEGFDRERDGKGFDWERARFSTGKRYPTGLDYVVVGMR